MSNLFQSNVSDKIGVMGDMPNEIVKEPITQVRMTTDEFGRINQVENSYPMTPKEFWDIWSKIISTGRFPDKLRINGQSFSAIPSWPLDHFERDTQLSPNPIVTKVKPNVKIFMDSSVPVNESWWEVPASSTK